MTTTPPTGPDRGEAGTFGWEGWLLVAAILVAFIVVPVAILFLPEAQSLVQSFGFTIRDAYLVLPFVPAVGLGVLGVWAAVRSRSAD